MRAKPRDGAGRQEADPIFSTTDSLWQEPTDLSAINLHLEDLPSPLSKSYPPVLSRPPTPYMPSFLCVFKVFLLVFLLLVGAILFQ